MLLGILEISTQNWYSTYQRLPNGLHILKIQLSFFRSVPEVNAPFFLSVYSLL